VQPQAHAKPSGWRAIVSFFVESEDGLSQRWR
jgi:hypothetical protein